MFKIEKELSDIAWNVTEKEYRADPALSYSTLARYEREGFNNLDHLFDQIATPSLTQGSMVDTLITGSVEEFNEQFYVADIPSIGDKELLIVNELFDKYKDEYVSMSLIPDDIILDLANTCSFQKNWRDDTRVRVLKERCINYYNLMYYANGRTIVDQQTYYKVMQMVKALKESPATCGYFAENDEMSPVRRYYQLKFKTNIKGVDYRSMADLIICDYEDKKIIPCDLKTSYHHEWDFQESFCKWNYMQQARLYWLNIKLTLDKDSYFKDFTLENYRFIVVNKDSLTPLVWEFPLTKAAGTLIDDEGKEYRDPLEIGAELRSYLDLKPKVPKGIDIDGINIITCLQKKEDIIKRMVEKMVEKKEQ